MSTDDIDSVLRPPQIRRPEKLGARGGSGRGAGRGDGHTGGHKRRPDVVLIIAVVAAVLAITFMIWGLSNNNASVVRRPIGSPDSTQVDSAAVMNGTPAATMPTTPASGATTDITPVDAPVEE